MLPTLVGQDVYSLVSKCRTFSTVENFATAQLYNFYWLCPLEHGIFAIKSLKAEHVQNKKQPPPLFEVARLALEQAHFEYGRHRVIFVTFPVHVPRARKGGTRVLLRLPDSDSGQTIICHREV